MAKRALLIGVSTYQTELGNLPAALRDLEAMQQVLGDAELGDFEVIPLPDPDLLSMQTAISHLFDSGEPDDLLLLYFSGHGITDEAGKFFFANCSTQKNQNGRLNKGTAVAASFVHDLMENSDCKRQVVILDCCHSGAFPEGMLARDGSGTIDFSAQLGGQGRIILTSSAAIEYSFERKGEDLAVYTRYLVEGIKTGAADLNGDGVISANELHDYVQREVQKAAPAMKPERYVFQDGEKIVLAKAAKNHLERLYRQEAERRITSSPISPTVQRLLERKRIELKLSPDRAHEIEQEILKPYLEYQQNLTEYAETFQAELEFAFPFSSETWQNLQDLQVDLNLRDEDVLPIHTRLAQAAGFSPNHNPRLDSSLSSSPLTSPIPIYHFEILTINSVGKEISYKPGQAIYFTEKLGDGISLEMVQIPAGRFRMGAAKGEVGATEAEYPQHLVILPSFWMGKFAVTQVQWQAVATLPKVSIDLPPEPSYFKGAARPVECVSWQKAMEFCDRLSRHTQKTYRLPSETEWEYACRAGTTTPFHFGATLTTDLANYRGTDWTYEGTTYPGNYGKAPKGIYRETTTDVGSFSPNTFGLYDMHGNVWEWCADHWHQNYEGAPCDGSAWIDLEASENAPRLLRGGSWYNLPRYCRSARRSNLYADGRVNDIGFRVSCSA